MSIFSRLFSIALITTLFPLVLDAKAQTRLKRPVQNPVFVQSLPRTTVSLPMRANTASRPLNLSSFVQENFLKVPPKPIARKRLMSLSNKNVLVLIDKSSSMRTTDIGNGISRWDWSKSQITDLTSKLRNIPATSLDVVFFNSGARKYRSVQMASLPAIFHQNYPSGGTNITRAMKDEIDLFLDRKAHRTVKTRPMVIAVITDGAPSSSRALKKLIKDTTHKINNPQELKITFLQVGNADKGNRLMPELDHGLVRDGARFDIVDTKPFSQVGRIGLVNALIQAVS